MDNVFESKKPFKVFLLMAVPLVISQMVNMFYSIADTYFISYAQDAALVAAVSLCYPILTIQMAIGNLMAIGGSSLISRLLGKKDYEGIKKANAFAFYMALILSVILAIVYMVFRMPILELLGADDTTIIAALPYYSIIAIGSPFMVLSFVPSNLLRSEGLAREAMVGSLIGTAVNLVLDPVFIIVFKWGAAGAALATVFANLVGVVYSIIVMVRKSKNLSLNPVHFNCGKEAAVSIFSVGAASSLMNILMAVSQMMYNKSLLVYGTDKIAAMGIANKIYYVPFMLIVGFSFGLQPVIGYYYGAKDSVRFYKILKQVLLFLIVLITCMSVLTVILAPVILPCFLKDPSIVETGYLMIKIQICTLIMVVFHLMAMVIFQATGKSKSAMIMSMTRQGFLFLAVLLVMRKFWGYMGVLWSQSVSNILSAILAIILFWILYKRKEFL